MIHHLTCRVENVVDRFTFLGDMEYTMPLIRNIVLLVVLRLNIVDFGVHAVDLN